MSRRRSGEAARRIIDDPELLTRTSWVDAGTAYRQVCKGRATGNKRALWLRWRLQTQLFKLGCFIDKHCGKVLFLGLLLLALCCVGLKTTSVETNVDRLWVEVGGRLQKELEYSSSRGSVQARRDDKAKDKNRKEGAGEGGGTTYELVIQTPKEGQDNLLNVESLLKHFDVLKAATEVTVDMYGQMWHFKDLCFASSFPSFDDVIFDRLLEQMVPCMIMTPLDCFWEGSKLLGPDHGVFVPGYHSTVKWTNLDPIDMIKRLKELGSFFPADAIMDVLQRAGVGSAYQDRPCLDPTDIHCPPTAPNKKSKLLPDVGYELTGGCTGFASKYMQWEESLIVGGVHKNKTGYMDRAEAFQSILLLLGSSQMYEYHKNTQKVHEIDWSSSKAHKVLTAWQNKFKQTVLHQKDETADSYTFLPFVSSSLLSMLAEFSKVSVARVSAGYVLMLFYACVSMWCCQSQIRSQSAAAMTGVVLIALSVAAGLGVCSVIGIQFNATTTQIIPFLALGLGVDDMFFILHIYRNLNVESWTAAEHIGECLKRTGVSVLLTSVSSFCAFFAAAIIPIPALRAFVLQAGILVIFNVSTILLIFPAVLSIDLTRKRNHRLDVLCCFKGTITPTNNSNTNRDHVVEIEMQDQQQQQRQEQQQHQQWQHQQVQQWQQQQEQEQEQPQQEKQQPEIAQSRQTPPPEYTEATATPPPSYSSNVLYHGTITRTDSDGGRPTTELAPPYQPHGFRNNAVAPAPPGALTPSGSLPPSATSSRQCLSTRDQAPTCLPDCCGVRNNFHSCSLTWFAKHMYTPLLEKTPIKVFVIVCCLITVVISIVGVTKVREGLDLTDVVPKGTTEYDFLEVRAKYFGFYTFSAVTQGNFDYSSAKSQKLMYEYHSAFQHVDRIIKKKDGGLPDFWLKLFRDWLLDIQKIFRRDLANNCFHDQGWHKNASDDGILGYKLMVQTGDIINSVDRDLIHTGYLVDDDGIINEKAFYVYMSAWTTNDALAFVAARPSFEPKPREWLHDSVDKSCTIEKSQPFKYTEFPFYLEDMVATDDVIYTIREIRAICEKFTERGLPNYPSGIPFTYWEQYINLRYYLFLSLLCILVVMFIVLATVLLNLWAAAILVAVLTLIVVELFGFMGLIGIKLSAVPAVILVMSVGIGVEFTVHLLLGFLTTIGSRNKRMRMSLEHVFSPVINGALSTFLGIVMMAGSEFDFIVKYFFGVLSALMVIGTLNGLVLLPVLLSICGPPPEVVPTDKTDRLSPPTPEPSPPPRSRRSHGRNRHHGYPRVHSDISLTTITEESSQYSSSEVIVPHIVMETTVNSGPPQRNSSSSRNATSVTQTRHLATLRMNVKLELHTPLPGAVEQEHSYYKSTRRKDTSFDSDSDCSNSSA